MAAKIDVSWRSGSSLYSVIADPIGMTDYNHYYTLFQLSSDFNDSLYPKSTIKEIRLIFLCDLTRGGYVCWSCKLKIYPNTTYGFAWNSSINPDEYNNAFIDTLKWFSNAYPLDNPCVESKGTFKSDIFIRILTKIIKHLR